MNSKFAALMLSCSVAVAACAGMQVELDAILADFASSDRNVKFGIANKLDSLLSETNSAETRSVCKLLKAELLLKRADIASPDAEELYSPDAYHETTNICASLMEEFSEGSPSWQFYAAAALETEALSLDGRHEDAFRVATNALSRLSGHGGFNIETNVCKALFGMEALSAGDVELVLKSTAAISLSVSDKGADISAYTNGLPESLILPIRELIGE